MRILPHYFHSLFEVGIRHTRDWIAELSMQIFPMVFCHSACNEKVWRSQCWDHWFELLTFWNHVSGTSSDIRRISKHARSKIPQLFVGHRSQFLCGIVEFPLILLEVHFRLHPYTVPFGDILNPMREPRMRSEAVHAFPINDFTVLGIVLSSFCPCYLKK